MTEQQNESAFETWAIVEIFGHTRLAGCVTETQIAGKGFVRVDVPDTDELPGFTRFYGPDAIYSITPCDETVARAAVLQLRQRPITVYIPPGMLLPEGEAEENDDPGPPEDGQAHFYGDWDDESGPASKTIGRKTRRKRKTLPLKRGRARSGGRKRCTRTSTPSTCSTWRPPA